MEPLPAAGELEPAKNAAQEALQRAVGEGRLTLDEFTDRVDLVWKAENRAELDAVTADLPAPVSGSTAGGRVTKSSIFDDVQRSGRFALPSGTRVSSFFGDVKLDLRQAVITESVVELKTFSWFGDIVVTVPEGVQVEVRSGRVFGDEDVSVAEVPPLPGSPVIRIKAWTTFGDVKVRSEH